MDKVTRLEKEDRIEWYWNDELFATLMYNKNMQSEACNTSYYADEQIQLALDEDVSFGNIEIEWIDSD